MIKNSVIQDLIDEIETALDKYKHEKYEGLDLDTETSLELFNECNRFFENIKDKAEDLDETIDEIIEDEPSDYDFYCQEDDRRRYLNVIGG